MKNIFCWSRLSLVAIIVFVFALTVTASQSGDFTYTDNGSEVTITGYTGLGGAVVIPGTISGLPVTSLTNTFNGRTSITSVTIPASVTTIEPLAFANCTKLVGVHFQGDIPATYSEDMFNGSNNTTVYYLPDTIGWPDPLAPEPFCGRPAVFLPYSYTINGGKVTITSYLGWADPANIPNTIDGMPVASIGDNAFSDCWNLPSVTIPASVTSIGFHAFSYDPELLTITVDPLNTYYSSVDGVLFNKAKTTLIKYPGGKYNEVDTPYVIPSGVTSIGDYAFAGCKETFNSVTIPSSVTSIGKNAFEYCTYLTSITIPSSVTKIGDFAFEGCDHLTSILIPSSVTNIGLNPFGMCTKLAEIKVDPLNPSYRSDALDEAPYFDGVLFNKSRTALIAYPGGKAGSYVIPSSVTSVGDYAFFGCSNLTGITIPFGITSIGKSAFDSCSGLASITLPSSITGIGAWAFWGTKLASITIPFSVTSIGNRAFTCEITVDVNNSSYSSVDGVLFNKTRTKIIQCPMDKAGDYAIPPGVTSIGDYAFENCTSLTGITIPSGVTSIGDYAFYDCYLFKSITIPSSVTSIGKNAFNACSYLEGAYFEGNAPSIGLGVFNFVDSMTVYYLPGTTGWGSTFGGWPTAVLPEAMHPIATTGAVMGFAFDGTNYLVGVEDHTSSTPNTENVESFPIGAQMLYPDGSKKGELISTGRTGQSTAVAFDGANYLLIWEDDESNKINGNGFQMYGQFISKEGVTVNSPFAISTQGVWFDGIKVMAFGGGKYLVTYTRLIDPAHGDDFDNRYIAGVIVDPNGTKGLEFMISTGYGDASDVAFDGTRFFVVWCEDSQDKEIRGQFVSTSGVVLPATEISVNASTARSDNPKSVTFDGTNYMVVWNDEGVGLGDWNVFGQLISPSGTKIGSVITITNEPGEQIATGVAFDGEKYMAVWADMRDENNWDLYGQYISRAGLLVGNKITISTDIGNQTGGIGFANGKYFGLVNNGVVMAMDGNSIMEVASANAVFITSPVTLTMAVLPVVGGVVSPATGIISVLKSESTGISATANPGYRFDKWTASSSATVANLNAASTTSTFTAASTITANFARNTATLIVNKNVDGNGTFTGGKTLNTETATPITASPAANNHFVNWTVTSGLATIANPAATSTTVTLTGENGSTATVTANFARNTATLTVNANGTGTAGFTGVNPLNTFAVPATQITALPGVGYKFVNWTVNSGTATIASATSANTTVTLTGGHASAATITANFAIKTCKVTFVSGANGTIDGDKIQTVNYGENCMTVTAYPAVNYKFAGWTGGFATGANPLMVENVISDMTITANFVHNTATLAVVSNGDGGTAGFTGVNPVNTVTAIPIIASPAPNNKFVNWTVSSGTATIASPAAASTTVTLPGGDGVGAEIIANFAINTNKVTFVAGANGTIDGNKVQTIDYDSTCESVTAVPNLNYDFLNWTGGTGITDDKRLLPDLTVVNIKSIMTITANFKHSQATLTMANDGNGRTTVPAVSPVSVNTATAIPITATPNTGYSFVNWTADTIGAVFANPNSASTTVMISGPATVTANFKPTADIKVLTMAKVGNGAITPLVGAGNVGAGEAVNITATADAGWHFVEWKVNIPANATVLNPGNLSTTVTLTGPATVTATFARNVNDLTLSLLGTGTTTPASGIPKTNIITGSPYSITATAATDWHFVRWTLVDGSATIANVNAASTTVTLTGEEGATVLVQAELAHNTTILTMAKTGSGTISGSFEVPLEEGLNTVNTNTLITIIATSNPGYHFAGWTCTAGPVIANKNSMETTVKLATAGTVTANFVADTETITFAAGGNGTVIGTLTQKVPFGSSCTPVKAIPGTDHHLVNWTGPAGFTTTDDNPVTVVADQPNNMDITANFERNTGTLTVEGGSGTGVHDTNTLVEITATTSDGFVNWTISGAGTIDDPGAVTAHVTLTGQHGCLVTVTANHLPSGNIITPPVDFGDASTTILPDGEFGSSTIYKINNIPDGTTRMLVTTIAKAGVEASGDCDLYVGLNSIPSPEKYYAKSTTPGFLETIEVLNPMAGDWYIMVYGYADYSGVDLKVRFFNDVPKVPMGLTATTTDLEITLSWDLADGATSYDIYRSKDNAPELAELIQNTRDLTVADTVAVAGTHYYYWVKGRNVAGASDFSAYARGWFTAGPVTVLGSGVAKTAISGVEGSTKYYSITVPAVPKQVLLEVKIYGGTGDCDLMVAKDGTVSYGVKTTSNETILIENPSGTYEISVYAKSDYSGLSMTAKYYSAIPLSPTGVTASKGTYPDAILVSWTASTTGAASYEIYRIQSASATVPRAPIPTDLIGEVSDISYMDAAGLLLGQNYHYWIKAKNPAGTSVFSTVASGYVSNAPVSVASVTVSNGTYFDKIALTWPKVIGATSYQIYRSPTDQAATITDASIANPCEITAAAHGFKTGDTVLINGVTGTMGTLLNGKSLVITETGGDTFTVPVNTLGKTYISGGTAVSAKHIERLKKNVAVAYDSQLTTYPYNDMNDGIDRDPNPGKTYYYWVQAVNDNGSSSLTLGANVGAIKKVGPTGVLASNGTYAGKVKITWTAVPGATSYNVYRTEVTTIAPNPKPDRINIDTEGKIILVTDTFYYDATAEAGVAYTYWVDADYNSAYQSSLSLGSNGKVSVTTVTTLAAPTMKSVSNGEGAFVKIAWNEVLLASTYSVYRKINATDPWVLLKDGIKEFTHTYYTAPAGQTYMYCVKAVNVNGISSLYSASMSGYAAGALAAPAINDPSNPTNTFFSPNLSGTVGKQKVYQITVPSGVSRLVVKAENVTGSCDLYAKLGMYPTTVSYNAKGTAVTGNSNKILTVTNPAAGTWYVVLYGTGTAGYKYTNLYIDYYTSTDIIFTQVPVDDQAVPFTVAFTGKVLDRSGTGIEGLNMKVRDPITGLETWLAAKTDANGIFKYSTPAPISGEGEYTYDFFFTAIPDYTKAIGSWTVKTKKSPGGVFDFSGYLTGTQIDLSQNGSATSLAAMQEYMNVRRGFSDGPASTDAEDFWVKNTLGVAQSDPNITSRLYSGLYFLLYGTEGAAVGNGDQASPGLTASPLLVHVAEGSMDTVLTNLKANGLIDDVLADNAVKGGIGVVVLTAVKNPNEDSDQNYDIFLYADQQLELLANLAGNGTGKVTVVSAGDKKYGDNVTSLVSVKIDGVSRSIGVRVGSFFEKFTYLP